MDPLTKNTIKCQNKFMETQNFQQYLIPFIVDKRYVEYFL